MEDSIVERILILIESYGLTSSAFADRIDVQRSSISHLISGRNKPSLDFIYKVLNHFPEINSKWLIMGTGPMKQLDLFDDAGKPAAPVDSVPAEKIRETVAAPAVIKPIPDILPQEKPVLKNPVPESPSVLSTPSPTITEEPVAPVPAAPVLKDEVIASAPVRKAAGENKKVARIVFFYEDNTFETFTPN